MSINSIGDATEALRSDGLQRTSQQSMSNVFVENNNEGAIFIAARRENQHQQEPSYLQSYSNLLLSKGFLLFSTSITTFSIFYFVRKYGLRILIGYGMLAALLYQLVNRILFWLHRRFRFRFLRRFYNNSNNYDSEYVIGTPNGRLIQIQTSRFHLNPYVNSQLSLMLVDDFTPAHYDILLRLDEDLPNRGAASEEVIRSLPQIILSASDKPNSDITHFHNQTTSKQNSSLATLSQPKEVHEGWGVCAICMEPMQPNQKITICPCLHKFHSDECIIPWLRLKGTCPICQKRVDQR